MSDGIYIALNGALGESDKLDVVATNLANAATAGYQRLRPVFHQALASAQQASGPCFQSVATSSVELDPTRGALRVTGRALDVTLPEASYLALGTARGERYTRAGSLAMGADGTLRTRSGEAVISESGRTIRGAADKGDVSITQAGEVWQDGQMLARLKVVTFPAPAQLVPEGGAVLAPTAASGAAVPATGKLDVGSVEESNTSVVGSMTELVSASRAFDAFQRAIDAFNKADEKVTTMVPNADQ
jgi:flagellar basal body rod protein FlgG